MCAASHRRRPWQDLPPELLGLVLARLASHADRVLLPAFCRAWRSGARQQRPLLPPPLPWLALPDGAFLSLPDGAIHRLPALPPPAEVSFRLSTGGGSKLFLVHRDGSCSLMQSPSSSSSPAASDPLLDLLAAAPLAEFSSYDVISKAVLASDHLAAVLTNWERVVVSARRPGALTTTASASPEDMFIGDIAVFKGDIYLLTADDELLLLVPGDEPQIKTVRRIRRIPRDANAPYVQRRHDPYATDTYSVQRYLVASGEQLLLVKRKLNLPPILPLDSGIQMRTRRFEVFEAADLPSGGGGADGCGRWREVDTLTGRAIFLSKCCSESLPGSDHCGGAGVGEDCIYFIREHPLLDSGVYNMRNRTVTPLPLPDMVAALAACDGPLSRTWFFLQT